MIDPALIDVMQFIYSLFQVPPPYLSLSLTLCLCLSQALLQF